MMKKDKTWDGMIQALVDSLKPLDGKLTKIVGTLEAFKFTLFLIKSKEI